MPRTFDSTLRWGGVSDYVTVSGTSAQTAACPANTYEVRVVSTTNCHIKIGDDPTAAATDNNGIYLPSGVVEYFHVTPGQRVAVIQDSAGGTLNVGFMTR
jgi:FtsP/CotA-like multicopper oxidase with cupredoxin domain